MKTRIVTSAQVVPHKGMFVVEEKGFNIDDEAKEICRLLNHPFPQPYSMMSGGHKTELEAAAYLEVRVTGISQDELNKIHAARP